MCKKYQCMLQSVYVCIVMSILVTKCQLSSASPQENTALKDVGKAYESRKSQLKESVFNYMNKHQSVALARRLDEKLEPHHEWSEQNLKGNPGLLADARNNYGALTSMMVMTYKMNGEVQQVSDLQKKRKEFFETWYGKESPEAVGSRLEALEFGKIASRSVAEQEKFKKEMEKDHKLERYAVSGPITKAQKLLQNRRSYLETVFSRDSLAYAIATSDLSSIHQRQQDYKVGFELADQAIGILKKLGMDNSGISCATKFTKAGIEIQRENYAEAMRLLSACLKSVPKTAVQVHGLSPMDPAMLLTQIETNRGVIHLRLNEHQEAKASFASAIKHADKLDSKRDGSIQAIPYFKLGFIADLENRMDAAMENYERARTLFRSADGGHSDPVHGELLYEIGILQAKRKQFDRATGEVKQALKITENYYGTKAHSTYLTMLINLARIYRQKGSDREFSETCASIDRLLSSSESEEFKSLEKEAIALFNKGGYRRTKDRERSRRARGGRSGRGRRGVRG